MSKSYGKRAARRRENPNKPAESGRHGGGEMVLVTLELIPGGISSMRRSIGTVQIANVSEFEDFASYSVLVMEAANPLTGTPARTAQVILVGHDRRQSVWRLLEAVAAELEAADWEPL